MKKELFKAAKEMISLMITLILLFNISSEAFAAFVLPQNEILSQQIKTTLETAKAENNSEDKYYKECVQQGIETSCTRYINNLKKLLSSSAENTKDNNIFENKKDYKEYEKEVKQAIAKEYTRAEEEIEKEIRQA